MDEEQQQQQQQQHTEEEDECHFDSSSSVSIDHRQSRKRPRSSRHHSCHPKPTQRTTTKSSQPNAQASKSLPRVIARPGSSLSGQNENLKLMEEEQQQQHDTEEDDCHPDSSSIPVRSLINSRGGAHMDMDMDIMDMDMDKCRRMGMVMECRRRQPTFDREPCQGTATAVQVSNPPPRVIVRPKSSPSGQNGQVEPKVEMSKEDAVCTFCYCILNVGEDMFKRKCNCQRERDAPPVLAHEICTTNNHQSNAPCSQCKEPFQNIPMTLHWASKKRKLPFPKGCFSAKSN